MNKAEVAEVEELRRLLNIHEEGERLIRRCPECWAIGRKVNRREVAIDHAEGCSHPGTTLHRKVRLSRVKHLAFRSLMLVGLRNRLRCPNCRAVGTFKPHGRILQWGHGRQVMRWLCKWCGYYKGPEGIGEICVIDTERKVWAFRWQVKEGATPREILARESRAWPWRG